MRASARSDPKAMYEPTPDFAELLRQVSEGSREAWDEILHHLHGTLLEIAHRMMRDQPDGHTLETSALVNEAYLKLTHGLAPSWEDRAHFLHAAARTMRHILIDHARGRDAAKRGGDRGRVLLTETVMTICGPDLNLLALDDLLEQLQELDPAVAKVVELHCFGGLSHEEIARNIDRSKRTVERMWRFARSWLEKELKDSA
jgi:RNA polymerase sigma factor (TIGR02999 family)